LKIDGAVVAWGDASQGGAAPAGLTGMRQTFGSPVLRADSTRPHVYACPAGKYGQAFDSCQLCVAGKYSPHTEAISASTCRRCAGQQQLLAGSTVCYDAPTQEPKTLYVYLKSKKDFSKPDVHIGYGMGVVFTTLVLKVRLMRLTQSGARSSGGGPGVRQPKFKRSERID